MNTKSESEIKSYSDKETEQIMKSFEFFTMKQFTPTSKFYQKMPSFQNSK